MKPVKRFIEEFRAFAVKGSMVDLAVGIVIGASFNSIVSSLVDDIIMPPLGLLVGRVDFSDLYINLSNQTYESFQAAQTAGAPTINYGLFVNTLITFLITAFAVFIAVRFINRIRLKEAEQSEETPTTRPCPYCTKEISRKARRCPFCTADVDVDPSSNHESQ